MSYFKFIVFAFLTLFCVSSTLADVHANEGAPIDMDAYRTGAEGGDAPRACANRQCDSLPRLLQGNAPEYPVKLLRAEITGQAIIDFTINVNGQVVDAKVASASAPEFGKSAIIALRSWKFQPATLHGGPVALRARQIFPFRVE